MEQTVTGRIKTFSIWVFAILFLVYFSTSLVLGDSSIVSSVAYNLVLAAFVTMGFVINAYLYNWIGCPERGWKSDIVAVQAD
jgi:hypothetical protein